MKRTPIGGLEYVRQPPSWATTTFGVIFTLLELDDAERAEYPACSHKLEARRGNWVVAQPLSPQLAADERGLDGLRLDLVARLDAMRDRGFSA